MRPVITTTNPVSGLEYRLSDDLGRQWFSHYGPDGSGYGYLQWRSRRPVGYDWLDLGHAFPVVMRKGPFRTLFDGQIVKIVERSGQGGDEIEIWALGWIHVCKADVYNYVYCDTRWSRWIFDETPVGGYKPDSFDIDTNSRLYFKPRRGKVYAENDYTALRYTFGFGEVVKRFTASYDVALPSSWPGKLEVVDSNEVSLWNATATASGSIDVTTTGTPTWIEIRFFVTAAGENTAAADTVYGKLTSVKIYSVNETTLDANVIGQDLVAFLSVAGHGLSDRVTHLSSPGLVLEPAFFDTDMNPHQIMSWCAQFGDSDGKALAWGVTFDDKHRLFLETVDNTNVRYVVRPTRAELTRGGDWGESAQKVYGVYTDAAGVVQRTADSQDASIIAALGSYFRRMALKVSGTTNSAAVSSMVDLYLLENKDPIASGSFGVAAGVWTPAGVFVPYDEILPGGLVQVREWRALEATLSPSDYRDKTTTFRLAGVKVDEDSHSAELIPNETSDAFARQMSIITQLSQSI